MKAATINGREEKASATASQSSGVDFDGLSPAELLAVHRCMLLSRKLDDKEIQLKNQSQIFFQISGAGAAEAGIIFSRVPQIPNREGRFHDDDITYVSLGEGATSEGEFWEALNTACTKNLPVLFLVEDNGYAISVPVEVQTAGGDISRLVRSFPGLHVDSIDGTDFFGSLRALREATAYVRERRGPAFVHARCIRPYSHSLSDDEKLYKPAAEREAEARRDPIKRIAAFLVEHELATED